MYPYPRIPDDDPVGFATGCLLALAIGAIFGLVLALCIMLGWG